MLTSWKNPALSGDDVVNSSDLLYRQDVKRARVSDNMSFELERWTEPQSGQ